MRHILAASVLLTACGPDDTSTGCKDSLHAGDLVITEVFADFQAPAGGTGTDTGKEWFEVYNNLDRPVALRGLTVTHSRPDGSKAASHTMTDVTIAPGQYFTLGNATPDLIPAYIDYGYSADLGDFYNTDGGKLSLKCGDSEIDSAVYDGVKSGHSRELSAASAPDYTFNDDLANWCQGDATEFEAGNFGTPGGENDCQPLISGACSDGGNMRDVVPPNPGDLVITEVMPSPAVVADTDGEWFEVKAMASVDLNGVGLDRAGDTANPNIVNSPDCIHLNAGDYGLFAHKTDMAVNGGLPAGKVLGTFSFALVSGSVATPGDVQVVSGGQTVDAITWTKSTSGKALQLDPDFTDAISNDSPSNFCDATTAYSADNLGTPSAANDQCVGQAPAGKCDMGGGNFRDIVKPTAGNLVITEIMPKPLVGNSGAGEWFEITNIGGTSFDLNGLGLDRAGDTRKPDPINSQLCIPLAGGGTSFALFARGTDMTANGGLMTVDATFGFSMVDTNGNAQVVDYSTCDLVTSPYVCTTIYDAVTWATSTSGASTQVKPGMYTTTLNDDLVTNGCPGVADYGTGGKGTPRAANACM